MTDERKCLHCGEAFLADPKSGQKYCSETCSDSHIDRAEDRKDLHRQVREMYYSGGMNEAQIAERLGMTDSYISHILTGRVDKKRRTRLTEHKCDQCGRVYVNRASDQKFCSRDCMMAYHKERREHIYGLYKSVLLDDKSRVMEGLSEDFCLSVARIRSIIIKVARERDDKKTLEDFHTGSRAARNIHTGYQAGRLSMKERRKLEVERLKEKLSRQQERRRETGGVLPRGYRS
jgi:ferredoxin